MSSESVSKYKTMAVGRVQELLRAEDGKLYWRVDRLVGRGKGRVHRKAGDEAGCQAPTGYRVIRIDDCLFLAHRLMWVVVHGKWPDDEIDHINRNRLDNRPENLREATSAQNKENTGLSQRNKSGHKGVCWNKKLGKWMAQCDIPGGPIHLGLFRSVDDASAAYIRAATERRSGMLNV